MIPTTFDTFALLLLLLMGVVLPLVGIWDFQRLMRWVEEGQKDARTKTYRWILFMEWGLVLAVAGWWLWAGRGLAPLGLVPTAAGWQWLAIGLGVAATAFVIWQMVKVMGKPEELDKARQQMGSLSEMAPQTDPEQRLFVLVAITAGVCEEILYRGVLMAALTPLVGVWSAVALSSVIFGLGHAYQGLAGVGKTALVGLAMALLTVFSGSLFVAIVLHAVIDIASGRIMGAALRKSSTPSSTAVPASG